MESDYGFAMDKPHPRSASFDHRTAHSDQQGLNTRPFEVNARWLGENGFQGFSVSAVHHCYDSVRRYHSQSHDDSGIMSISRLSAIPSGGLQVRNPHDSLLERRA